MGRAPRRATEDAHVSLTGRPLLVLLLVLFVLFTVAAISERPRLRVPRLLRRAVTVVLSQLCAVLLVMVAVNDWGMFYGSWDDLFGGTGDVRTVTTNGAPVSRGLPASMGLTGWSTKDELPTKGGVFTLRLDGPSSKLWTNSLVFLPPQYFQKGHENERFPVVETIAGYPGDVPQLVDRLGYPAELNKQVAAGRARPMILVLMRPTLVPPRDTECVDIPGGPQTLTFFSKDVPALVKKDLRATDTGWGAMGHSTGGYCAAKLAMTNPEQFSTAVSLSGYFTTHEDETTGSLFGGQQKLRDENDLTWRVTHLPVPRVAIFASMGQQESGPEGRSNTKAFMDAAKPPMTTEFKMVDGGGHNFGTYQRVMPDAFAWLSTYMGR